MALFSNAVRDFTVAPGCPWYDLQQRFGPPNVNWCENTICSLINEPANTWSNFAYVLVAVYLWLLCKQWQVRGVAVALVFVGVLSAVYHATNNFLTQMLDFLGMSFVMSFFLAYAISRLARDVRWFRLRFIICLGLNLLLLWFLNFVDIPVQLLLIINLVPIALLELYLGYRDCRLRGYSNFYWALAFLILGQAAAQVDLKRWYCVPENLWLHGHVIWHVFSALGILFAALHIRKHRVSG